MAHAVTAGASSEAGLVEAQGGAGERRGKGDEHVVAGVQLGRLAPAILDALAWMLSLLLSRAGVRCLAC